MVGDDGFEPTQRNATDLQSAPTLQLRRSPIILYTLSVNPSDHCGKESDIRQRSPSVNLA